MPNEIRRRYYSPNTEKTYIYWVKQYIYFHDKQHPKDLNSSHIEQFPTNLATIKNVAGTTKAQAFNAVVFLYRHVLKQDVGDLDYLRNVRRFKSIPTVLSKEEVVQLFQQMKGTTKTMAGLLYGAGLRVNECVTLWVQDIDLSLRTITIRNTKGQKARVILITQRLLKALERQLLKRKQLHVEDRHKGWGYVDLPNALNRKYKKAATSFLWRCLFLSSTSREDAKQGVNKRWHCSTTTLQKSVRSAVRILELKNMRLAIFTTLFRNTPSEPDGYPNYSGLDGGGAQRYSNYDDLYAHSRQCMGSAISPLGPL